EFVTRAPDIIAEGGAVHRDGDGRSARPPEEAVDVEALRVDDVGLQSAFPHIPSRRKREVRPPTIGRSVPQAIVDVGNLVNLHSILVRHAGLPSNEVVRIVSLT